jgi:hypothetical protein
MITRVTIDANRETANRTFDVPLHNLALALELLQADGWEVQGTSLDWLDRIKEPCSQEQWEAFIA